MAATSAASLLFPSFCDQCSPVAAAHLRGDRETVQFATFCSWGPAELSVQPPPWRRTRPTTWIVCSVAGVPVSTDPAAEGNELQKPAQKKRGRKPKLKMEPMGTQDATLTEEAQIPSNGGGSENGEAEETEDDPELEKGYRMSAVCDKLIDVFMVDKPKPEDWRKLLAFSEEWCKIRPYFYKRCKTRAEVEEHFQKKADLLKLGRRLKEVDDDMMRHDELIAEIEGNQMELDAIVARRRKDFTGEFFEHVKTLCDVAHKNMNRREELVALAAKILAFVQAYDRTVEDDHAIKVAQMKLDDILNSPSLDAASRKIDELARGKQLDSTFMLLITKAWAAAKESTMMKDEVKDIMYHLYMVARGNMQRLVPKEVRIIRHILSIEDPKEQFAALTDAFSPGDEMEGKNADTLYTKPDHLLKWIDIVLDAYKTHKEGTLIKEAQKLMNPAVIVQLEALKEVVMEQFM